jgi:hypothetical protein
MELVNLNRALLMELPDFQEEVTEAVKELQKEFSNIHIKDLYGIDASSITKKIAGERAWTKRDYHRLFVEPAPDVHALEQRAQGRVHGNKFLKELNKKREEESSSKTRLSPGAAYKENFNRYLSQQQYEYEEDQEYLGGFYASYD